MKEEQEYPVLEEDVPSDRLSSETCVICGTRLTKDEHEEFEDECMDCVYERTSGIIDDNGEELEFD